MKTNRGLLSLKVTIFGAALLIAGAAAWYPGTDGRIENFLLYSGFIIMVIGLLTGNKKREENTENDSD